MTLSAETIEAAQLVDVQVDIEAHIREDLSPGRRACVGGGRGRS